MIKKDNMESEIRIIKLDRKALQNSIIPNESSNSSKQTENEKKALQKQTFFATDYFDSLSVTKRNLNTPLVSLMDYSAEENSTEGETSSQSYALYCSEKMKNKYECNAQRQLSIHRDNPFENSKTGEPNIELPYLSIIQIHITPEIFRRIAYGINDLWEKNNIILEPFLNDLYDIIDKYGEKTDKTAFVYRIYQLLSAGDLAIVIKSKYPTTPFEISSRIRARKVKSEDGTSQWTLYKTYTLFAIECGVDLSSYYEIAKDDKCTTKVVIRGCYSCKYWNEQPTLQGKNPDMSKKDWEQFGLNGEYDFSIDLTMEEFAQFYPIIQQYKGLSCSDAHAKSLSNKVAYLKELLKKGYLSYINERYLLSDMNANVESEYCDSNNICLDNESLQWNTLAEENNQCINDLIAKFEGISSETIRLRDAHKNLEQYFKLMKRQILSCIALNQTSDTRIYVREISKQLNIALNSIDIYRKIIIDEKNTAMIDIMVKNIKNVVHMIDCYTAYIRNNNLQSLQTPNCNIESSMNIEKILIGYNEYLKHIIRNCPHPNENDNDNLKREYFPIIIPDLHYMDISVQILFPEGFSLRWETEPKQREFLMIVESPTLAELGDTPIFMALLFHEMAHQLRYKKREERNSFLLDMLVETYASLIASNIAEDVCQTLCCKEVIHVLFTMLKNGFKNAILPELKAYLDKKENEGKWKAPLLYFRNTILRLLEDFSRSWQYQAKLEDNMKYFMKSLQKIGHLCKEPQFKYMSKIETIINNEHTNNEIQSDKEWHKIRKKLIQYAFVIVGLSVYDIIGTDTIAEMDWLLQEEKVEEWINNDSTTEWSYGQLWEKLKKGTKDNTAIEKISWLKSAFDNLGRYFEAPTELECQNNFKCWGKILELVYETACSEWKRIETDYADSITGNKPKPSNTDKTMTAEIYRSWSLVGRYLGIDHPMSESSKKFSKMFQNEWVAHFEREKLLQKIDIYREVTADMFMYTLMNMKPFTYVNLAASIIPSINLDGSNLERIITVLYIMSDGQNESKESNQNEKQNDKKTDFNEIIVEVWNEFIKYCKNMLEQDNSSHFIEIFSQLEDCKNTYSKKKIYTKKAQDELENKIMVAAQNSNDNQKMILIHIKKIFYLLCSISDAQKNCINALESQKLMKDDYICGKHYWQELRCKLKDSSDSIVKKAMELSESNQFFLRNRHYQTGVVDDGKLNEENIQFLLRSYYSQRITDSRKDIEE